MKLEDKFRLVWKKDEVNIQHGSVHLCVLAAQHNAVELCDEPECGLFKDHTGLEHEDIHGGRWTGTRAAS